MIKGNCLCKAVQYEVHGEIEELVICHCDQCKLAQGTPFVTNVPISIEMFKILCGEYQLRSFYSSKNKRRVFCSICASPIFSQRTDNPDIIRLRAGTITSAIDRTPDYQQHCQSKAKWFVLNDDIPNYPGDKPGS